MKFSINGFFNKYDQMRILSHLLKKSFLNGKLNFLCSATVVIKANANL